MADDTFANEPAYITDEQMDRILELLPIGMRFALSHNRGETLRPGTQARAMIDAAFAIGFAVGYQEGRKGAGEFG